MRRFYKALGMLVAVVLLISVPAFAADLQATIGGLNSSGNYHFTVDSDGVLDGATGSTMTVDNMAGALVGNVTGNVSRGYELVTATEDALVLADVGKIMIATATATTTFTLPAAVVGYEFTVVAASSKEGGDTIKVDPATTADTILYLDLDAGDEIDSAGATGDSVTLKCISANTWLPVNMGSSAWTDGGAS
jgi:hypothetical protein